MKTFSVYFEEVRIKSARIEAEDEDQARDIAQGYCQGIKRGSIKFPVTPVKSADTRIVFIEEVD